MKELPIVKAILTEGNQGLKFMSAVESPAIMVNWVKFNDEKPIKMAIQNEEQQVVFAPALIPDLPIYRNHNGREFYLMFDKKTIEQIALYRDWETDRKSTRLNSSHSAKSRMPSSA